MIPSPPCNSPRSSLSKGAETVRQVVCVVVAAICGTLASVGCEKARPPAKVFVYDFGEVLVIRSHSHGQEDWRVGLFLGDALPPLYVHTEQGPVQLARLTRDVAVTMYPSIHLVDDERAGHHACTILGFKAGKLSSWSYGPGWLPPCWSHKQGPFYSRSKDGLRFQFPLNLHEARQLLGDPVRVRDDLTNSS